MQRLISIAMLACALAAPAAHAQAPRTFVSSTGNDANPCSRVAPCRNFRAAIAAVALGGEVVALDSAGYGPFTIDRSVTVTADGVHAAVTAQAQANAITISGTTPTSVVVLRNLALLGPPSGSAFGVDVATSAQIGTLAIDDCTFSGLSIAVVFQPDSSSGLHVRNTVVRSGSGINAAPTTGHTVFMTVDNSLFDRVGNFAVSAGPGSTAVVTRSVATGGTHTLDGVFAASAGATAQLTIVDCVATQSHTAISSRDGATVRVGNTTITGNAVGLVTTTGGTIVSLDGNHLDNTANGTFDSHVFRQ